MKINDNSFGVSYHPPIKINTDCQGVVRLAALSVRGATLILWN